MRTLATVLGALTLLASTGVGQDRPEVQVEGYLHEVTDPLSQPILPSFGVYVAGQPGETDGERLVHLQQSLPGIDLTPFQGRRVTVNGFPGGVSQFVPFPTVTVTDVASAGGTSRREAVLEDLSTRGVDFFADGSPTPAGGFDADRFECPAGSPAQRVVLAAPPPGGADFFTDTAYLCSHEDSYWAHRTGGFAGVSLWMGPFDLPEFDDVLPARLESAPSRVSPSVVRTRKGPRTRRLIIRRQVAFGAAAPLGPERYVPEDFDLGPGITVESIGRVTTSRVRLRVRIERTADRGRRPVRLLGRSGDATLIVRRR